MVAYSDAIGVGGAEHTLATLLRHLDERFQVDVVATREDIGEMLTSARPGSRLNVVPFTNSLTDLRSLRRQIKVVRSLRPEIVHVNRSNIWSGQSGTIGGLACREAKVVVVEHAQPVPFTKRSDLLKRRLLAPHVDALVAVGNYTARSIESMIGLDQGFVRTIHNGVEVTPASPRPDGSAPPTIGAIGRLSPEKGFDLVPRMLALLPDARAIVIGDGPTCGEVEDLARDLGVADRMEMQGWQDSPGDWYPEFDLLVVPSRLEGSPPLVALNAMMAGVPVVAADVGSISEAVADGQTGVLVPPDSPTDLAAAAAALLADRDRRLQLGRQGRELVLESFSAPHMAARFEALYGELRGEGPPPLDDRSAAELA
jgi:glycosyltransferase involved in cell wall biosynthesis